MSGYVRDPQSVLDYVLDWSAWLAAGETIATVVLTTSPAGLTVGAPAPATSNTTTTVTVWLSGGTVGQTYTIGCRITTSAGRTDERSITVTVIER